MRVRYVPGQDDIPVAVTPGQDDEDLWANPTPPVQASVKWPPPMSFDVQEPSGLFGEPDEDFNITVRWANQSFQSLPMVDATDSNGTTVAGEPDEDFGPNQRLLPQPTAASIYQALPLLPDAQDVSVSVAPFAPDADPFWLSVPPTVGKYVAYRLFDSGELIIVRGLPPSGYLFAQSIGPALQAASIEAALNAQSLAPALVAGSLP